MRKLFIPVGLLALVGAFIMACSDLEPTNPSEPLFGKGKPASCDLGDLQALADEIRDGIDELFSAKKKPKAAHEIFNNIERKVCGEQFAEAVNMALGFYGMTYDQLPDKLSGDAADAAALVALVFQFASDPSGPGAPTIPPGALEPTGGIGVVYPGTNDTIWTNNDEAAFVADAGSFAGNGPVTVVLTRLADPIPGVPGYPIPGFQAYPEAYDFSANFPLVGEAEFWMCVVTDPPEPPFERLVIGHALLEGAELLTPRLVEDYPGQVLDCGGAVYQPPVIGSADAPGWLRLAGSILKPVMDRVLNVKPLSATFFGGKGLGGRGTSFSPFAPVDGGVPHPVLAFDRSELNQPAGPGGTVNFYYIGVTNWADYPAAMFTLTGAYGPCGSNPTPSRTWVEIFDASDGSRIYGFCAFDSPDDLTEFWFSTPTGQAPPDVYIELWDRADGLSYRSNTIVVPTVFNTLTVEGTGSGTGTITRSPDINCVFDGEGNSGDCQHTAEEWVQYGTLVATPDAGSTFTGWSGACSGTGGCDVEMGANKTATATFTSTETFTLDIVIVGDGYVSDESEAIDCPETCSAEFSAGSTVFLWATDGETSYLDSVLGNCEEGGDPDCTIIMNQGETVEFVFQEPEG